MNQRDKDTLNQLLIKLVQEKKPTNIKQLINLTKMEITFVTEQEIMQHVLQLESQGRITLKEPKIPPTTKLGTYLKKPEATWYWITIILATVTTLIIFTVQENLYPIIYIRYILGAIFILFLPGYTLIKLLFPEKELEKIEHTALSIGMSLALVPITGLILNYTPWGIRTIPLILSLLTLTIVLATVAVMREYQAKTK